MGLFGHKDPPPDPLKGGSDGVFNVLDDEGRPVRYTPDDFDEIFTTTDEHDAGRHVGLGWLLLDEMVGPGEGNGGLEFRMEPTGEGRYQSAPHELPGDDVTTYILGYLKPGRTGAPAE